MAAWQRASAVNLAKWQTELNGLEQTSDRLISDLTVIVICLHLYEARQIAVQGQLKQLAQDQAYERLYEYWQSLYERSAQRSAVFALPHPSAFSSPLRCLLDTLLKSLLGSLYYPDPNQYVTLPVSSLGQIYEQTLALAGGRHRKSGGVYYTPTALVDYVVNTTLDKFGLDKFRLDKSTKAPLLLDPACGGGAFLVAAYQYLLEQHRRLQQRPADLFECRQLLCCIHGVDIDPVAVRVTKLSLWLTLLETASVSESVALEVLPSLDQIIHWGNAVVSDAAVDPLALDWQAAFPQARVGKADGGFDLVLGNPPYLDAELMTIQLASWRSYCTRHYQAATGNWDLFCVFIEKALQLCRPGGIMSLVVPNKLLAANYAGAARRLLSRTRLWSLRDYSQVAVFNAAVYPVVYIAENIDAAKNMYVAENSLQPSASTQPAFTQPASTHYETRYEQMQTLDRVGLTHPIQLVESAQPWLVGIQAHRDLIQRLEQFPKLGDWVKLTGAATVAEAYRLQGLICNQPHPDATDLRFVNSGTLDRYRLLWGQKPLRYLGQSYLCPVVAAAELGNLLPKRLHQSRQPKLIVAGMGLRIESVLDLNGRVLAGKSTTVIGLPVCDLAADSRLDPHYLLGLLNSRLLSFYLLTRFGGNRLQGGYLRIGPPQLRQLPLAIPNLAAGETELYQEIIRLVQQRLTEPPAASTPRRSAQQEAQQEAQIDAQIDQLVYDLYRLSASEISLVKEATL